jgi:hypothetical protein
MERARAHQHVRDAARLEPARVRPRRVAIPRQVAAKQDADVVGDQTVQPLERSSQSTNATMSRGSDSSICIRDTW